MDEKEEFLFYSLLIKSMRHFKLFPSFRYSKLQGRVFGFDFKDYYHGEGYGADVKRTCANGSQADMQLTRVPRVNRGSVDSGCAHAAARLHGPSVWVGSFLLAAVALAQRSPTDFSQLAQQ